MGNVKFIHAADLHLDSPFKGLQNVPETIFHRLQNSPFLAFQRIVLTAIKEKVDFVLLSGDLYDGENRILSTQIKLRKEFEKLKGHGIQVYIIHGNHDHLGGNWIKIDYPENVHIFSDKGEVKLFEKQDGTKVHIYGFSYPKRHVMDRAITYYTKAEGADFHIGMLHGSVEGNTDHSPYLSFSLQELMDMNFSYWALGHIHKQEQLSLDPPIIYAGNPQGRNRKEQGEKGCFLVSLEDRVTDIIFIPTCDIYWEKAKLLQKDIQSFDDLLETCREQLESLRKEDCAVMAELHIQAMSFPEDLVVKQAELLEILQEEEEYRKDFVWPYALTLLMPDTFHLDSSNPLFQMIKRQSMKEELINNAVKPLFSHVIARKYLDDALEEKHLLLEEAETLLFQLINAKGGVLK
ncbi:metallophosphoesterase family protein [Peribacillus alkalitolerans]|uniref:metallophosphoesterase family protein n=1 Tax=Peribacillus alkalitolerans TaxID=1550385 RepID=UPI0013D7485D|nr:DNA repair exonuclease [Peribacillus alkalitolerans]